MNISKLVEQASLELPLINTEQKVGFATMPDIDFLNESQRVIYDNLLESIKKPGSSIDLIKGYAGTGKTTLTNTIMETVLATTSLRVAVTAPTNKAVKVCRSSSKFSPSMLNLTFSTIHSILGLRESIDRNGKQIFIKMRDEDVKVEDFDVIFVDEVSMFQDELFEQLVYYQNLYDLKIIFIGDPAQIPPVGKTDCIPFTEEGVKEYKIEVHELTEVLRQAADNPIIALTMKIRAVLGRSTVFPIKESNWSPETQDGAYFVTSEYLPKFNELLDAYFTSVNFKNDADYCKVIAWTNRTVRAFNRKIRVMIYGTGVKRIEVGEKLIANKPILDPDSEYMLFSTNDEFEVVSYEVTQGKYKEVDLTYYLTKVVDSDGKYKTIKIIHETSAEDFKLIKGHLADVAKSKKKGTWEATKAWKDFYRFQEFFADVNYNYAITAHKSQGSTYQNVFVIHPDIDQNRKVKERNRIKYTAMTRPSRKLFIVE